MTFNLALQKTCQRKERMREAGAEVFRTILEPFRLEKLYPPTPVETSPGIWKNTYDIQPHQRKVHDRISLNGTRAKFLCFSGGVGSGKSRCVAAEVLKDLRTHAGMKYVCAIPYDYYADEFLLPIWWQVLPEDSAHIKRWNAKTRSLTLTNGSTFRIKAYDDPEKIKGWEAHRIWIEEGSEIGDGNNDKALQIWNALLMRLRAAKPAYEPRVLVTQNPKGHNWVWKVFIKNEPTAPQPLGDIGKKTVFGKTADGFDRYYKEWEKVSANGDVFYTIATGTTANAYVPPGYVSTMLGQMADTPGLRQRMVEGEFNPINTLVYDYPIYSERTHVVDYQRFLEYWEIDEVPDWWRIVVGIDCGGQRSPWAIEYYCQTEDGHWVCFDEIYQTGLTWGEIADLILEKSARFSRIEYWIDPISSNQKQGPTSDTIKAEFAARGLPTKQPKGYNKMGGIARVQNFLNRDHTQACPYLDDILNEADDGTALWEVGKAQLYYLTNVPGKHTAKNPCGHAAPGNVAEKTVYRWDSTKNREPKATEEGLTPVQSEKLIDRDDHAQTAEMFMALGINPIVPRHESSNSRRQSIKAEDTPVMYGRSRKHRRI